MSKRSKPVLLFLHIPRTAGTTLNRAIRLRADSKREILASPFRNYSSWKKYLAHVQSLPPDRLDRIRYFRGHFSYGIHELLPKPALYVTMLRDPVDRVLSSYYFFIRQLGSNDVSIVDFVRKGREGDPRLHVGWTDNVQVRMLAAHDGKPVKVPIGSCTTSMLELAKNRIASDHFVLAGLTECFDESILLLKNKLGWRSCYYVTFNVSGFQRRPQDVSKATRDLIESFNMLDLELYAFAKQRLEEEILKAGPSFSGDLERFRSRNRIYDKALRPFFQGAASLSDALQRS
jgi:Galactose-3-O-sulfotransferase